MRLELSMPSEQVLVIPVKHLGGGQGYFPEDAEDFLKVVSEHGFFMDRAAAEHSSVYKQVITYCLVTRGGKHLCYRRSPVSTETRLRSYWSLGVGGHVNPDDQKGPLLPLGEAVTFGAYRELEEELGLRPPFLVEVRGVVNDDSTEVGRVHVGVVIRVDAPDSLVIPEGGEIHMPTWQPASRITPASLESWSLMILPSLVAEEVSGILEARSLPDAA
jgi:predicted NUDIX family phosphoesterase